jgi:hypothetical protein
VNATESGDLLQSVSPAMGLGSGIRPVYPIVWAEEIFEGRAVGETLLPWYFGLILLIRQVWLEPLGKIFFPQQHAS